MSAIRHVLTVGGFTAFSRVLGLGREMLQSRLIGAGVEQSAFALAFALPNMARKLFGEGALTAAFVPLFKTQVERGELECARRLAQSVMSVMLLVLTAIAGLVVLGTSAALAGAIGEFGERTRLILDLVRILFPYMIFICGAAFGMGVLNALGRFREGAAMPALLNVIWIGSLAGLWFFPSLTLAVRVKVVCWAIVGGGVLQMAYLCRCMAKRGFPFRPRLPKFADPLFRAVWRNTFIAALGAGAVQVNYMLDQVLAQYAAPWAAGVIGYAERLMDLPLGVIGVAFGTVLLPTFAGHFAKDDLDGARRTLGDSIVNLMAAMIPAAAGIIVLAPEITAVIYQGRAFDAVATVRVSRALTVYAGGLAFFAFQKSLVPWFQAQGDMRTPVRVTLLTVVVNAVLNVLAVLSLPVEWRHVGLAGSTVFCGALGAAALLVLARRRNGSLGLASVFPRLCGIAFSALLMSVALLLLYPLVATLGCLLMLVILVPVGGLVYAAALWTLRLMFAKRPCRVT